MPQQLLVVDDEPRVAQLLCRVAARVEGWEAIAVHSFHGLQGSLNEAVRVLVLDLHMPDCTPDEVFEYLAQQVAKPKVLLTSGIDQGTLESIAQKAQQQGLNLLGVLPKPFSINDLKQFLDQIE